jgi:thioredoxin reductase (NADPH)
MVGAGGTGMSSMAGPDAYDLAIIGAGPTGLFAAFYAGMRNLKTLVLETLSRPGGQITALYPEKYIYDVGGLPAILGRDLVADLYKQGSQFGAEFRFGERVEKLEVLEPGGLRLTTPEGSYSSQAALLCAGLGAFHPNRLDVPGAAELTGRGISYVVRRREDFLGRRVLIVGGGDTALDWALELRQWAREVTLIHRFEHFEAHERSVVALRGSNVSMLTLKAVRGGDSLREAVIVDNRTGLERTLELDEALVCIGFKADMGPIQDWGLALSGRQVGANGALETSLPGVFAAGDIVLQEGVARMTLIASGFGHAAQAVGQAVRFLRPAAPVFHGHSSQRKGMKYAPTPGAVDEPTTEPDPPSRPDLMPAHEGGERG